MALKRASGISPLLSTALMNPPAFQPLIGRSPTSGFDTHAGSGSLSCCPSTAEYNALMLPLPKEWEPARSITS